MIRDFLTGMGFMAEGFRIVARPGMRRYAAAPVLVSLVVFLGLAALLGWGFDTWMAALLPAGWDWLEWLLWPLFAVAIILVWVFTYIHLTNLIGAPFNDLLAERVLAETRGTPHPEGNWSQLLRDGARAAANTVAVLVYSLRWAIPLLVLTLIPGLNLVAPALWLVFNAWLLALEYADYPLGARGLAFREQRALVARERPAALGFGLAALVATSIPVVNLVAMPAAVAGATRLFAERVGTSAAPEVSQEPDA
ncbi:sulfate transporter CysZ [Thiohalorhabdus methylotrophus]|uniref:Sulfate transporter CysZ n=1 Tax=Thiohalorhabdus methylotrophus TaxID=3242694 RepID=A0ABV4U0D0_9GAMM